MKIPYKVYVGQVLQDMGHADVASEREAISVILDGEVSLSKPVDPAKVYRIVAGKTTMSAHGDEFARCANAAEEGADVLEKPTKSGYLYDAPTPDAYDVVQTVRDSLKARGIDPDTMCSPSIGTRHGTWGAQVGGPLTLDIFEIQAVGSVADKHFRSIGLSIDALHHVCCVLDCKSTDIIMIEQDITNGYIGVVIVDGIFHWFSEIELRAL